MGLWRSFVLLVVAALFVGAAASVAPQHAAAGTVQPGAVAGDVGVEAFAQAGFVVERGLATEAAVASAQRAALHVLRQFPGVDLPGQPIRDFEAYRRPPFDEETLALLAPLVLDPGMLNLAERLLRSSELRLAVPPLLRVMPTGAHRISWHQDWEDWRSFLGSDVEAAVPSDEAITEVLDFAESLLIVFVPLTTTVAGQSGGVLYQRGSHRRGLDLRRWSPQFAQILEDQGRAGGADDIDHAKVTWGAFARRSESGTLQLERGEANGNCSKAEAVALDPLDVVAHSALTWHSGSDNSSPQARWHVEVVYQDASKSRLAREPSLPPIELLLRSHQRPKAVIHSVDDFVSFWKSQQAHRETFFGGDGAIG